MHGHGPADALANLSVARYIALGNGRFEHSHLLVFGQCRQELDRVSGVAQGSIEIQIEHETGGNDL